MGNNTAIVAISRKGAALARSLAASLSGDKTLFLERRLADEGDDAVAFDLPLRPVVRRLFEEYRMLVLFMPVGAAVRLLAPCIQDKHSDPAVVCVDDAGRFAVSLLSGHVGGADRLAHEVSQRLGAIPVVTSASYVTNTLAVDLLGREFGWHLEADSRAVTRASAAVVNGERIGIYQEAGELEWWPYDGPLPDNIRVYSLPEHLAEAPVVAALVITDRLAPPTLLLPHGAMLKDKIVVMYRPRSLVVGMGCRRGVPVEELEQLLIDTFQRHNLALKSLRCIATADLKKDEPGINQLADKYGVPVHCYGAEELNRVFEKGSEPIHPLLFAAGDQVLPPLASLSHPSPVQGEGDFRPEHQGGERGASVVGQPRKFPTVSAAAHRLLGVWGVSEPAALLASGSSELLVAREKSARATIAVARMNFAESFLATETLGRLS